MSKLSAAHGARFKGVISVKDAGLIGMITLRGDLSDAGLAKALKSVSGCKMPQPRRIETSAKGQAAWMSPDELLLILQFDEADAAVAKLEKALKGSHFMAVNVSDARGVFDLSGKGVRNVLAKGTPADMSPEGLPLGEIRRSRIGQLPVAFWLESETKARLICFRSVADHMFNWLSNASRTGA